MYPQYGGNQPQQPIGYPVPRPSQPPRSIKYAVIAMYACAAIEILYLILDLIGGKAGRYTAGTLSGACLWVGLAWANKSGKNWARITVTVIIGWACLGLTGVVSRVSKLSTGNAVIVIAEIALQSALFLAAIILLYRKSSTAYFRAMRENVPRINLPD